MADPLKQAQYAQWLVDNADRKGTPEFDTVARAYQEMRSSVGMGKAALRGALTGFGEMASATLPTPGSVADRLIAAALPEDLEVGGVNVRDVVQNRGIGGVQQRMGESASAGLESAEALPKSERMAFQASRFGAPALVMGARPHAPKTAEMVSALGAGAGAAEAERRGVSPEIGGMIGGFAGAVPQGINIARDRSGGILSSAQRKVIKALRDSGMDPEEALARVEAMGPEATLADVSRTTQKLAKSAVRSASDEVAEQAAEQMEARGRGQAARFEDKFRAAVRGHKMADDMAVLEKRQIAESQPFYDTVDRVVIQPDDELIAMTKTKDFKQAWKQAQKLAERDGRKLPDSPVAGRFSKLRDWDYVKQALDDMVAQERKKQRKTSSSKLAGYRDRFRDKLDDLDQSGAYKEARRLWAGPAQAKEMMLEGQKFWKPSTTTTAEQFEKMDPGDLGFYRIGAIEALVDKIEGAGFTRDVTKMFDNPRTVKKMRTLFGEELYEGIADFIALERQMARTSGRMAVGSDSFRNFVDAIRLSRGDVVEAGEQLLRGNTGNAISGLVGRLKDKLIGSGFAEKRANEIMGILLEQSPEMRRTALRSARPLPSGSPIAPVVTGTQGLNIITGGGGGF